MNNKMTSLVSESISEKRKRQKENTATNEWNLMVVTSSLHVAGKNSYQAAIAKCCKHGRTLNNILIILNILSQLRTTMVNCLFWIYSNRCLWSCWWPWLVMLQLHGKTMTRGFFNCIQISHRMLQKKKEDFPTIAQASLCKYMYNILSRKSTATFVLWLDVMHLIDSHFHCVLKQVWSRLFQILMAGHIQAFSENLHPTKRFPLETTIKVFLVLLTYIYYCTVYKK